MSGFPRDMFYMGERKRYTLIMCHTEETDGTYGYYYSQHDTDKAIEHYNKIKAKRKAEGSNDSVLYLSGCQIMSNPEAPLNPISEYLQEKLDSMNEEEVENLIQHALKSKEDKWKAKHKISLPKKEETIFDDF